MSRPIQITPSPTRPSVRVEQPAPTLGSALRLALLLACFVAPSTAASQAPDCAGGIVYDDRTFENAYTLTSDSPDAIVQLLDGDAIGEGGTLERVCMCWIRQGLDPDLDFDLVFHAVDPATGRPGELLASVPASVTGVATRPPGSFHAVELGGAGPAIPETGLFVGARWDPGQESGFFLCADLDGPKAQPAYLSQFGGGFWRSFESFVPGFKALAIRFDATESSACTPGPETLCLGPGGRFRLEVRWERTNGATGAARAIPTGSETSGLFWYFEESNWEMLVKVLDGCASTGHYWVFAASTTNVGYTLIVTDTATGAERTYLNPPGRIAPALTDTTAFATCDP